MQTFIAWFLAAIGNLAIRAMAALGFSSITVIGLSAGLQGLTQILLDNISGMPFAVLQLAGLGGAWEALQIILGCLTWCLSWHLLTGASRYVLAPKVSS